MTGRDQLNPEQRPWTSHLTLAITVAATTTGLTGHDVTAGILAGADGAAMINAILNAANKR